MHGKRRQKERQERRQRNKKKCMTRKQEIILVCTWTFILTSFSICLSLGLFFRECDFFLRNLELTQFFTAGCWKAMDCQLGQNWSACKFFKTQYQQFTWCINSLPDASTVYLMFLSLQLVYYLSITPNAIKEYPHFLTVSPF